MSTLFHDLDAYQSLPRLGGLVLSPDGRRLITSVSVPDPKGVRFRPALWEVDPAGERPARRLTRGTKAESGAAFTPDGTLLFTSARPDPAQATPDDDAPAALWCLPEAGEAWAVGTRPGGVSGPVVARDAGTVVVTSMTMPAAVTGDDDAERRTDRTDRKISAVLHTGYPIRDWDHDRGPDEPRLLAGTIPADGPVEWRDLTPEPGVALVGADYDVTPDGTTVVTDWRVPGPRGGGHTEVVAVDVATGERRTLVGDTEHDHGYPQVSPDGRLVACARERLSEPDAPPDTDIVVVPLAGGEPRVVTAGWDRWPTAYRWSADGAALVVTAHDGGRAPIFRIAVDGGGDREGDVTRLTGDDGSYTDVVVDPGGEFVYALRSSVDRPPAPVRIDAATADQEPVELRGPVEAPDLPGTLTEVTTTAEDGTSLRAWLVLPERGSTEGPAPLVVWIHGGPLSSWNAWQWRWCPWLMAARGYAVLLPDPAMSTGYGLDFVARGWGAWGDAPYTDVLALTETALTRADVDADRTAAMGGSFGGYMANWLAGHTDRFRAIVAHASLWSLDRFGSTTDNGSYWRREVSPDMAAVHSPHLSVGKITTPMLVVHGDKDYRVPISEALSLWYDLVDAFDGDPADLPHRFLYYPDENHWIRTPNNAVVWYETVLAFLDHHVLGAEWVTPDALR